MGEIVSYSPAAARAASVALGSDIGKRRQTSLIASSSRRARVGA